MSPHDGIKHKAAFKNSKHCLHIVIAALCFILEWVMRCQETGEKLIEICDALQQKVP